MRNYDAVLFTFLCILQIRKKRRWVSGMEMVRKIKPLRIKRLCPEFADATMKRLANEKLVESVYLNKAFMGWRLTEGGRKIGERKICKGGALMVQDIISKLGT